MIPEVENEILEIEMEEQPSLTYCLDVDNGRISKPQEVSLNTYEQK